MKCSCCGKTNQIKTNFELYDHCDGAPYIPDYVDVYLCLECGHYDFYSKIKVEEYKTMQSKIKALERKIEILNIEIEELESPNAMQNIDEQIKNLESLLNSPDTTEEEKEWFEIDCDKLIAKRKSIPKEINRIKKEIRKLEENLHKEKLRLKYNLK